jgi:hypothetical protein
MAPQSFEKPQLLTYSAPTWGAIKRALGRAGRVKDWCRGAGCSPAWLWERDDERPVPWWAHSLLRGMGLDA